MSMARQSETATAHAKKLTVREQTVAIDTAEPVKSGINSAFNKALTASITFNI